MLCIKGFFLLFGGRNAKQCTKHLKGRQGQVLNKFVTRVVNRVIFPIYLTHFLHRPRMKSTCATIVSMAAEGAIGWKPTAILHVIRHNPALRDYEPHERRFEPSPACSTSLTTRESTTLSGRRP